MCFGDSVIQYRQIETLGIFRSPTVQGNWRSLQHRILTDAVLPEHPERHLRTVRRIDLRATPSARPFLDDISKMLKV